MIAGIAAHVLRLWSLRRRHRQQRGSQPLLGELNARLATVHGYSDMVFCAEFYRLVPHEGRTLTIISGSSGGLHATSGGSMWGSNACNFIIADEEESTWLAERPKTFDHVVSGHPYSIFFVTDPKL